MKYTIHSKLFKEKIWLSVNLQAKGDSKSAYFLNIQLSSDLDFMNLRTKNQLHLLAGF